MASSGGAAESGDQVRWKQTIRALLDLAHSQQQQLQSLADDRAFLEGYIRLQNDRWAARVRLLQSHIDQLKSEEEMGRRVHGSMLDAVVGIKNSEALLLKKRSEIAESDLGDCRECLEILGVQVSQLQGELEETKSKEEGKQEDHTKEAKMEMEELKQAYEKLSTERNSEVAKLLEERDLVWCQFKQIEKDHASTTAILKTKTIETDQAKEAAEKLQLHVQNLEHDKLEAFAKLESEMDKFDRDRRRLDEEAACMKQEATFMKQRIEELQLNAEKMQSLIKEKDEVITKLRRDIVKAEKSTAAQSASGGYKLPVTPITRKKQVGIRISKNATTYLRKKRVHEDEKSPRSQASNMRPRRCSRRQEGRDKSEVVLDAPKLFNAKFKVPKLKEVPPDATLQ